MSDLRIPVDEPAEEGLAGVVVASARGYRLAVSHGVTDSDYYIPACRRLHEAAGRLTHLTGVDEESLQERIRQSARIAGVPEATVCRLTTSRPVQWDVTGALAERVVRAAEARAAMSVCQTVFRRLGEGERLERVLADMGPGVRQLLGAGRPA